MSVSSSETHRDQHLDSETTWKWWVKCIFILLHEINFPMGSSTENRKICTQISQRADKKERHVFFRLKLTFELHFWLYEKIQGLLEYVSQSFFQRLWTTRRAAWWPPNLTWSTQRWCTLSQQILTEVITLHTHTNPTVMSACWPPATTSYCFRSRERKSTLYTVVQYLRFHLMDVLWKTFFPALLAFLHGWWCGAAHPGWGPNYKYLTHVCDAALTAGISRGAAAFLNRKGWPNCMDDFW